MKTNLINLKLVFNIAKGELSSSKGDSAALLPVFFALEHMGFLLENAAQKDRQALSSNEPRQLYQMMK